MLSNFLAASLGPAFTYCRMYRCMDNEARWLECEARDWPLELKLGCRSGRRYQKTHDFDLSLGISDAFRYVITIRHPVLSLSSWWVFRCAEVGAHEAGSIGDLMLGQVEYWNGFVRKWALDGPHENLLVMRYEDLTTDPAVMRSVLSFVNYGTEPLTAPMFDGDYLRDHVRPARDLTSEPHFDPVLYNEVQSRVDPAIWEAFGYSPIKF